MHKKDIHWTIEDEKYVIRNVPCHKETSDSEEFVDADTTLKMVTLKELMVENQIPKDVDIETYKDVKF